MTHDMRDLLPKLREIGFGAWAPLGLASAWTLTEGTSSGRGWVYQTRETSIQTLLSGLPRACRA
jgi:hypothetical protein